MLQIPSSHQEWEEISSEFQNCWDLPHVVGAMDGKHIMLQAPFNSGSEFYNYKQFFSIVMFALVDASYKFIFVDIGCQGRISDGGVFNDSILKEKISNNSLNLPSPKLLEGTNSIIPYYFVADSAFPLGIHIMKPYPGVHPTGSLKKIFNYRLSRARRVVENAFGISASVFRVLRKPMLLQPEVAQLIVMTICHLHNFLIKNTNSANIYAPPGSIDSEVEGSVTMGRWRLENNDITSLLPITNTPRRASLSAHVMRDKIAEYCCTVGKLSWQDHMN